MLGEVLSEGIQVDSRWLAGLKFNQKNYCVSSGAHIFVKCLY